MKLTIYMKSGNRIPVCGVKDYRIKNSGDEITHLEISYYWYASGEKLLISTIALSQIEAITKG